MSHFSVAVFTDGKKSVDELLAPYDENITVSPYVQVSRQQIIDKAFNRKKEYSQHLQENKEIPEWVQQYLDAETDDELYQCEYDEDYSYDAQGNQLSTYNPNSKWDWWSIGGRWNGLLKASKGEHGEGGLLTPNRKLPGKYDIAKVSDIDFSPDQNAYTKALRWWEVVVEALPLNSNEKKEDFFNYYKIEYLKEKYKTKEAYAKCQSSFNTFAVVLPDGKWYEKGKMGWWACVSDEENEWDLKYKERFIDTANPEWTLTIVDCHI